MVNEKLNAAAVLEDDEDIQNRAEEDMEQFLLFQCDALRIGIYVEYVMETLINQSITRLPMVPGYIRGVINLRGEIVPIIDVRERLGKPGQEEDSIIVLDVHGTQVGILVDRVDQMVKMPRSSILPMPANNTQKLICGMCSLPDGGTMLVLDSPVLLEI